MSERRTLTVPRTARYHVLGGAPVGPREAWFVLHGYGQLAGAFAEAFRGIASERLVVAPEALSRFYLRRGTGDVGASWMTREAREDEIADVVRYLDLVAHEVLAASNGGSAARANETDPVSRRAALAVHALGFSQGGAAVARWAVLGDTPVERVTLWGAAFPPDVDLAHHASRLRAARWTFVHGARDASLERALVERDVARLRAAEVSVELVTFDGGHELDTATLERLANPSR